MGNSSKALKLVLATGLAAGLAGCGGNAPSRTPDTTTNPTSGGDGGDASALVTTNPPHTIVITYPHLEAIQDEKGGVYHRKVSALVQDAEGHLVADGTPVYLSIMDTIIAQGTIESPNDSISGAVLTDIDPTDSDGAAVTFDTVSVVRNNAYRQIEAGDMVLTGIDSGLADEQDKYRLVADTAIGNTTLPVTATYQNVYPSPSGTTPSYASGETNYVVGASLLGAQITGESQSQGGTTSTTALDGGTTTTTATNSSTFAGVATTVNGVAHFRITYPANINTINTDCQNSSLDTRVTPTGSARVILAARVNESVTTVNEDFCFSVITNGSIAPDVNSIGRNGVTDIPFELRDGGDEIAVPFWNVRASVTLAPAAGSGMTVQVGSPTDPTSGYVVTGSDGWGTVRIDVSGGISGDTATVTLRALNTTTDITITIP